MVKDSEASLDRSSTSNRDSSKLETGVALLIALATIVGAFVSWRAALSEKVARGADYTGLRSLTWTEESKALHVVDAYEDYRLFLQYRYNDRLGELIVEGMENTTVGDEESAALNSDLEAARQIAEVNVAFLDETKSSRYLNRDGTFALNRELGEKWAAARKKNDMNYAPRFEKADEYRKKNERQVLAGVLITIGLILFTLFESFSGRIRIVFLVFGSVLSLGGTVWAVLLERMTS